MTRRASKTAQQLSVELAEAVVPVELVRRRSQKHIRIRISANGKITLSAPYHTSLREIKSVLSQKEAWIRGKLQEHSGAFRHIDPYQRIFLEGISYEVEIRQIQGGRGKLLCDHQAGRIIVQTADSERAAVEALIAVWLKREARERLSALAAAVSSEIGIPFKRIFLRNQKTRWGSSSSAGNISLNWRVVMLPPEVQYYLVVHELAHQEHLNHSPEFWKLVARHCPRYRQHEKILKQERFLMGLFR